MTKCVYIFSRYAREPNDGKQFQFYRMLEILCRRFDELVVIGLAKSIKDLEGKKREIPGVEIEEVVYPGSYNIQVVHGITRFASKHYVSGVKRIVNSIKEHDSKSTVFFFEGFPLGCYVDLPKSGEVIWGEVDSYLRRSHRIFKTKGSKVSRGLRSCVAYFVERKGLWSSKVVHVYSDDDRRYLQKVHKCNNVRSVPMVYDVIENCNVYPLRAVVWADASYFYLEESIRSISKHIASAKIENVDFLIGRNPKLKKELEEVGLNVFERIDDLDRFLGQYGLVILPDCSGTGIKNRTLRALALGRCVAGTKYAWEGISFRNGIDGYLFREMKDIEKILLEISEGEVRRMGKMGCIMLNNCYSIRVIEEKWRELFDFVHEGMVG